VGQLGDDRFELTRERWLEIPVLKMAATSYI